MTELRFDGRVAAITGESAVDTVVREIVAIGGSAIAHNGNVALSIGNCRRSTAEVSDV